MKKQDQNKISTRFKKIMLLNFFVLFFCTSIGTLHAQNDFELIAERVIKYNKEMTSTANLDKEVDRLLPLYIEGTYNVSNYNKDTKTWYIRSVTGAHFSDIDYTSTSAASWPPATHPARLKSMADAYTRQDSKYYKNADVFDKFSKLLSGWHDANPGSTNWWPLSIAVPKSLTLALLYMEYDSEEKVDQDLVRNVLHRIRTTSRTNPANEEGPNKTDMALHWLNRALIRQNADTLNLAAKYSFDPLVLVNPSKEGIQKDYSYFQHANQLQIASYGGELMNTTVAFLEFFNGTQFGIAADRLETFSKFARETYFGSMRGQYFPYMLTGRGVTRSNYTFRSGNANFAKSLMNTDPAHKDEYELIAKKLEKKAHASEGITPSSRLYHIGDYISHNRVGYQYTIRAVSSRTLRSEWGNQEGFETYFMSDASNAILQDGDEYENIYGVWDWSKVPGVTSPLIPRGHIPNSRVSMDAGASTPGTEPFVGGVSDNLYSAYTYTQRDGWGTANRAGKHVSINTIANKSWFMFDKEVVAIGSNLSSNATHADLGDLELITTVNQAILKGNVLVGLTNGTVETLSLGNNKEYNNVKWVVHNNIGYVFPEGGLIKIEAATKSGAWNDINGSQSSTIESKDLFALWLSHGKKAKDEKYSYLVVPNIGSADAMQAYCDNELENIQIITNNDIVQAVRHKSLGIWQIIFRKAGIFKHDELTLKADQPCAAMIKDINIPAKTATMYVGDVMQYGKTLTFGIDIPGYTNGLKAISVDNTTSGVLKGKSIEVSLDSSLSDYVSPKPEESGKPVLFQYQSVITADTYVDGRTANSGINYGSDVSMTTKNDIPGWAREAYIKVPLNDLDKIDDFAKYDLKISIDLYLLRTNSGIASTNWTLQPMTEEWDEGSVTWGNKPAYSTNIVGLLPAFAYDGMLGEEFNPANSISIDISNYAIEEYKAGKRELSLLIYNDVAGGKVDADFATREHPNEVFRPRITLKAYESDNKVLLETKTFNVIHDAYVKNGNGQNTNYGSNVELSVNTGGAGYHRETYLMFPIDEFKTIDMSQYEAEAYMSVYQYGSKDKTYKTNWDVRSVTNTDWTESTIKWNGRPEPVSEVIASQPGFIYEGNGTFQEKHIATFDVTNYTLSQIASNAEKISFNIKGSASAGNSSDFATSFASKEYKLDGTNVDERTIPKLIIKLYQKKVKPIVTITGLAVKNKSYDGTMAAELDMAQIKLVGVDEGDDVQLDLSDIYLRFENADEGTNKVIYANGLAVLKGQEAYKYQLEQPTLSGLTADITEPNTILTVSGIKVENKEYDGTTDATLDLTSAVLTGQIAGDDVQIDASDVQVVFQSATAGNNKAVTITGTFKLKGADIGTYQIAQPSLDGLTANILPRSVTVSGVKVSNKEYDGTTAATPDLTAVVLSGIIAGDDAQIDASDVQAAFQSATAGNNKAVTVTGAFKLKGADVGNYQITQPSLSGLTANIAPLSVTVSGIKVNDKEHDGTTDATLDLASVVLTGIIAGDDVQIDASDVEAAFQSAAAGDNKAVTITGSFKLKGADAGNYQIVQPSLSGLTANITDTQVSIRIDNEEIEITADNKAYYVVGRDNSDSQLNIKIEGASSETPTKVDVSKPSIQEIKFAEGQTEYVLTVEKRFNFEDLVSVRWNNTLTVKNTPKTHGFEFTAYQWYENGSPIAGATKQSYSAGKNGERLNDNSLYHVDVTDKATGKVLRTWDSKVELKSAVITAYPNPVKSGQSLTISANLTSEQSKGAKIYVYNINGSQVGTYNIDGAVTVISMPAASGTYIVRLQNDAGVIKSFNILVN